MPTLRLHAKSVRPVKFAAVPIAVALLAVLVFAPSANAALKTCGNPLTSPVIADTWTGPGFIRAVPTYTLPEDGTILRWRMATLDAVGGLRLKVLRQSVGMTYTVMAQSDATGTLTPGIVGGSCEITAATGDLLGMCWSAGDVRNRDSVSISNVLVATSDDQPGQSSTYTSYVEGLPMIQAEFLPSFGTLYADPGKPVTLDGTKTAGEWDDAINLSFPTNGGQCEVHAKQDGDHLLVVMDSPDNGADSAHQIMLDTNDDSGTLPQVDDRRISISRTGFAFYNIGNGSASWATGSADGIAWGMQVTGGRRCTEFRLDFSTLGVTRGTKKPIGIALYDAWTGPLGNIDYRWPATAVWDNPSTWNNTWSRNGWDYPADSTAPSVTVTDVGTYSRSTTLTASWSIVETETWATGTQYAVGHSSNTTDVVDWTDTAATAIALGGMHSGNYVVRVRVGNPRGLTTEASSNGITIDAVRPATYAPRRAGGRRHTYVRFYHKINDPFSGWANTRIEIRTLRGRYVTTYRIGNRRTGVLGYVNRHVTLRRGIYRFLIRAIDLAGNNQSRTGWNYLRVW